MRVGETDLATDIGGGETEVVGGAGWVDDDVGGLLGAGLMGGTVMDDIITTGGAGEAAGTVLTTTVALDFAGSVQTKSKGGYTSGAL